MNSVVWMFAEDGYARLVVIAPAGAPVRAVLGVAIGDDQVDHCQAQVSGPWLRRTHHLWLWTRGSAALRAAG
jgi:hypothetical protein